MKLAFFAIIFALFMNTCLAQGNFIPLKPSYRQKLQPIITIQHSVIPLVSTIQQVEKLLGTPMTKNGYVHTYDTNDARITIWYGGVKASKKRCKLNVSNNTVIDVLVSPKKRPFLSELQYNMSGFKKERTMDEEVWNYVNEELGIFLHTYESSPTEKTVIYAKFSPRATDEKERCVAGKT
jgi:hypothetical protein